MTVNNEFSGKVDQKLTELFKSNSTGAKQTSIEHNGHTYSIGLPANITKEAAKEKIMQLFQIFEKNVAGLQALSLSGDDLQATFYEGNTPTIHETKLAHIQAKIQSGETLTKQDFGTLKTNNAALPAIKEANAHLGAGIQLTRGPDNQGSGPNMNAQAISNGGFVITPKIENENTYGPVPSPREQEFIKLTQNKDYAPVPSKPNKNQATSYTIPEPLVKPAYGFVSLSEVSSNSGYSNVGLIKDNNIPANNDSGVLYVAPPPQPVVAGYQQGDDQLNAKRGNTHEGAASSLPANQIYDKVDAALVPSARPNAPGYANPLPITQSYEGLPPSSKNINNDDDQSK